VGYDDLVPEKKRAMRRAERRYLDVLEELTSQIRSSRRRAHIAAVENCRLPGRHGVLRLVESQHGAAARAGRDGPRMGRGAVADLGLDAHFFAGCRRGARRPLHVGDVDFAPPEVFSAPDRHRVGCRSMAVT
jgi:hypothetical protein